MDIREGIERKLDVKRKEVADLELKLREQLAYVRALEDTLRMVDGEMENDDVPNIRPDSDVGRSREALRLSGNPLHISDLLKAIGKTDEKKNRISLAGTLAGYVRRAHVFTRPGPNIFGLLEFNVGSNQPLQPTVQHTPSVAPLKTAVIVSSEPPEDFGMAEVIEDDVPF